MKYLIKIIVLFITTISVSQNKDYISKANISRFVDKYFIVENATLDLNNLPDYIFYNKTEYDRLSEEQKNIFVKYLKVLVDLEHEELKVSSYQYKLKNHSEVSEKLLLQYRLNFEDKTNVYYLICNNKIITHFILDEKFRIISFAPNVLVTHGGKIEPYMLNKIE
jgi:hypothetical protein